MFLGMKINRRLRPNIEGKKVPATDHVKLLGVEIDSKLTCIKHVEALCHKVNKKITDFSTLTNFISMQQAQAIPNAAIFSNFNHCPLLWMLCNKGANKKLTALMGVLSRSCIKIMNHHMKHCLREWKQSHTCYQLVETHGANP